MLASVTASPQQFRSPQDTPTMHTNGGITSPPQYAMSPYDSREPSRSHSPSFSQSNNEVSRSSAQPGLGAASGVGLPSGRYYDTRRASGVSGLNGLSTTGFGMKDSLDHVPETNHPTSAAEKHHLGHPTVDTHRPSLSSAHHGGQAGYEDESATPNPANQWFANYSGYLGKKRENKGIGNSLALGFGVSAFQRRWFACSAKDQAVLYFKEDPNSLAAQAAAAQASDKSRTPTTGTSSSSSSSSAATETFPQGFIPYSEILFVDHMATSAQQQLIHQNTGLGGSGGSKRDSQTQRGSSTPPPGGKPIDEKEGRLFDIVASFRVYHLQADTTMEALKWVQAIRDSIREYYNRRTDKLLGSTSQAILNTQQHGHKAPLVRTPRTPEHSKRFWSNSTQPSVNPNTFPMQHLKQVLRDETREQLNGMYGRQLKPSRLSELRRHFFELNFSIASLNQASYFDQLLEDFDSDTKIVEFAWNIVMRGVKDAESWGPKAFKSTAQAGGVPTTSQPKLLPGVIQYVDSSASTVLLTRSREVEMQQEEVDEEVCLVPTPARHRRAISCSRLPDSFGREKKPRREYKEEDILLRAKSPVSQSRSSDREPEYSRSQSSKSSSGASTSTSGSTRGRRRGHRRIHSDLCPLATSTRTKYTNFDYHLLNKYALYHAAACKVPAPGSTIANNTLLNPSHLYRIFAPYKRLESWLHTDAFLTLLLNDEALINEVPLALPLVWAILQWRNHDSDPHSGSGFIDDSILHKNWMDDSVDGEDDGFTGGQGATTEEEQTTLAEAKKSAKAGFKSVHRAHLRVNSFSDMNEISQAAKTPGGSSGDAPLTAKSSASPQPMSPSTPVVYGANGQVVAGGRGLTTMSTPASPKVGAFGARGAASAASSIPGSPAHTHFGATRMKVNPGDSQPTSPHGEADMSPMSPTTPLPDGIQHSPNVHSRQQMHAIASRAAPILISTPRGGAIQQPGSGRYQASDNSPNPMRSHRERDGDSEEPGSATGFDAAAISAGGPAVSLPSTRRNSFVAGTAQTPGKRATFGGADSQPTVSFAMQNTMMTAPGSKRGSIEAQGTQPRNLHIPATSHTAPGSATSSPSLGSFRKRDRGTIFQATSTGSMRGPNLLSGGGGNYNTMKGGSSAAAVLPPLPADLPHWKVRSLVACKYCFQSSLEFMQAIAERYGMDAGKEEHVRACKAAYAMGKRPPRERPESKFTISVSNTLFSLLLTPLYSIPSLSAIDYATNNNPVMQDSFNVLGKVIVSSHIWPTLLACLQSNQATCSLSSAPFLKHHVLKDLNTLFIGTNVRSNNRNCKLLFKFFTHVGRQERKILEDSHMEREKEKRLNDRDREKNEKKRRKRELQQNKIMIGAWQKGLLSILRNHVPSRGGRYPLLSGDLGIERLHSKIYQYTLNLFGVFHFYKFQCIGLASSTTVPSNLSGKAAQAAEEKAMLMTSCADFEKLFKESFWRSMYLHKHAQQEREMIEADARATELEEAANAVAASGSSSSKSEKDSKRSGASASSSSSGGHKPGKTSRRSSVDIRQLDHTVARSMLTTMLQRLIFKIKSKTCNLDQRWPAVGYLIQQVKSFVFSTQLKNVPGAGSNSSSSVSASGLTQEQILGFELDFAHGIESLHTNALYDDIELLEKCLELIRSMRLYQEIDLENMPITKQKEIKAHVEKESHSNKGRMLDINDPSSKLKLNSAHEDLSALYSGLNPSDQLSLKFLLSQVSFLKDSICFLSMMQSPKGLQMEQKEMTGLVQQFISMERREKVFVNK